MNPTWAPILGISHWQISPQPLIFCHSHVQSRAPASSSEATLFHPLDFLPLPSDLLCYFSAQWPAPAREHFLIHRPPPRAPERVPALVLSPPSLLPSPPLPQHPDFFLAAAHGVGRPERGPSLLSCPAQVTRLSGSSEQDPNKTIQVLHANIAH